MYCRHPDDVKRYINTNNGKEACNIQYTEEDIILAFHRALKDVISDTSECIDSECNEGVEQHNQQPIQIPANNVREPSSMKISRTINLIFSVPCVFIIFLFPQEIYYIHIIIHYNFTLFLYFRLGLTNILTEQYNKTLLQKPCQV